MVRLKKNDSDSSAKIAKNNSIDILNTDFISSTKTLWATYNVISAVQINSFQSCAMISSDSIILLLFAFQFRKSAVEAVCSSHWQRTYLTKNRIKDSKSEILICKTTIVQRKIRPRNRQKDRLSIRLKQLMILYLIYLIKSWIWKKKGTRSNSTKWCSLK